MSYYSYGSSYGSLPVPVLIFAGIMSLCALVVSFIAQWKLFEKAGESGWKCLIPIYNLYIWFCLTWKKEMFFVFLVMELLVFLVYVHPLLGLLVMIPLLVLAIIATNNTSKSFGQSKGFTVGLIFLPFVFLLILAFGSSEYIGPQGIPELRPDHPGKKESESDFMDGTAADVKAPPAKNGPLWAIAGVLLGTVVLFFGAEVWLSMTKFSFVRGLTNSPFTGFRNYEYIFHNGTYFPTFIHTLIYGLVAVLFSFLLGLAGQGMGKSGKAGKGIGIAFGLMLASVPRFFWEYLGTRIMRGNTESIFLIDMIYSSLPWAGLSLAAGAVLADRSKRKVVMPALVVPVMQLMVLMTGQESFPSISLNMLNKSRIERVDALIVEMGIIKGQFSVSSAINVLLVLFNLLFAVGGIFCMAALVKKSAPGLRKDSNDVAFTDFLPGIAVLALSALIGWQLLGSAGLSFSESAFHDSVSVGLDEMLLTVILAFGVHILFQFAIGKSSSAGGVPMALFIFAALSVGRFIMTKYLLAHNLGLLNTIFAVVPGWVFSPRAMAFSAVLAITRPSSVKECIFNALAGAMITAAFGVGTPIWAYVFLMKSKDISMLLYSFAMYTNSIENTAEIAGLPPESLHAGLMGITTLMIAVPLGIGTAFTSLSVEKE